MNNGNDCDSEWRVARRGISLLLNNKTDEADALFSKHPNSFHVKAGKCFFLFMNALMSYEEDKLDFAMQLLREMEKECAEDIGWLKSMKSRVFGYEVTKDDPVKKLEREIVLADSQVSLAMLTILQQELSGYVRSGWMLRKAWRVYQHTYSQILNLYRRTFGSDPSAEFYLLSTGINSPISESASNASSLTQIPQSPSEWSISCNGSAGNATPISSPSGLRSSLSMFFSLTGITSEQQTPYVEPSEVARLMSAVSFGYGIFQLCVSLLPPSLLKLIHFLGFEGDRQAGLATLMYARLSEDMRAPLATLSLLWYHTIVRPFFALDGPNVKAGVDAAKKLIAECQPEFEHSALFLFFQGRVERLESNVDGALRAYDKAVEASTQREVKLLCLHEVAWCHLICLNYEQGYKSLVELQQQSRWSKAFYAYLAAVCLGATGNLKDLLRTYWKIARLVAVTSKESQLGIFILRRAPKLVDVNTGQPFNNTVYYKFLVYELLYLWNAMPSCSIESLQRMLADCTDNHNIEPTTGLSDLIEGAAHCYLGSPNLAAQSYRNCLQTRIPENDFQDQHVSAFALYELGSILSNGNLKNIEEGKSLLLRAQNQYKDYDFESRLNVRIHSCLKKIN